MGYLPILEITRADIVESVHHGALAVSDPDGRLRFAWGDPNLLTFMRSAAKPMQALVLVESGAAQAFDLTPEEVAVICASHSGTDAHVATVRGIQDKIGIDETELKCGVHPPYDPETSWRLRAAGEEPTPLRHNCSGKHTGMLALARFLGVSLEGYTDAMHPVQQRIASVVAEMCGLEQKQLILGIDGCSVPTFAVPLKAAAYAFARLVDPSGLPRERADACRIIVESMTSHPDMVAGPDRFDTRLMRAMQGQIVAKGGAEGYQGLGLRPGSGADPPRGLGVALKIADGDLKGRARPRVCSRLLEALGVMDEAGFESLVGLYPQEIRNNRGRNVGTFRHSLKLAPGTTEPS